MSRPPLLLAGLLFLVLGSLAGALRAQVPEDTEPGWHIVRPGDTLEGLAKRYLGSQQLWRAFARLNPQIQNPHLILPGQRVRIFLPRGQSPAARVAQLSRKVEALPRPIPWEEARIDDLLVERDGLRTYRKSSAEMAFPDGTRLRVTEDSLVFLQKTGTALRGVERKSVEIVEGQADLEARHRPAADATRRPEVEIVLGASRTTARPDASGSARSRARRAEEGGARIMIYGGEGEVEAAGAKVQLPAGTGTAVAATGPPAPPEKLLAAPRAVAPEPGAEVACANPLLSWQPVPEAASYTVEVCRDPACGALVERATGLAEAEWRPASLPAGELFWRATARSRSGLDGYPGEAARLAVTSDQPDTEPPAGTVSLAGPQVRVGSVLFAGPGARLEVVAEDAASGIGAARPAVAPPFSPGPMEAGAEAVDRCGNRAALAPIAFTVDAAPPDFRWDVVDYARFGGFRSPDGRRSRPAGPIQVSGGVRWSDPPAEELRIESDLPGLYIHAPGARVARDGREVTLGAGQMLRAVAEDAGARVAYLSFRLREEGGRLALEVETADLVGNVRRESWEVRPP